MHTVIAIDKAVLPYGKGKGIATKTILEVLYSDGSVAYRCITCEKEYETFGSCMAHRSSHTPRKTTAKSPEPKNRVAKALEILSEAATTDLRAENRRLQAQINRLQRKIKEERTARRAAEKKVTQITAIFREG